MKIRIGADSSPVFPVVLVDNISNFLTTTIANRCILCCDDLSWYQRCTGASPSSNAVFVFPHTDQHNISRFNPLLFRPLTESSPNLTHPCHAIITETDYPPISQHSDHTGIILANFPFQKGSTFFIIIAAALFPSFESLPTTKILCRHARYSVVNQIALAWNPHILAEDGRVCTVGEI